MTYGSASRFLHLGGLSPNRKLSGVAPPDENNSDRRRSLQLRAGRVVINRMTDDAQAPWGGFKYSGIGREYGRYGIEAFLEPRAILGAL